MAGALVVPARFLAEVALAGFVTGQLHDLGCTYGCHPRDPEFLPLLAGLLAGTTGARLARLLLLQRRAA
jgi:hypothetical protein